MTPEAFAQRFLALDIPLTIEEYDGLIALFEELSPGISECLENEDSGG